MTISGVLPAKILSNSVRQTDTSAGSGHGSIISIMMQTTKIALTGSAFPQGKRIINRNFHYREFSPVRRKLPIWKWKTLLQLHSPATYALNTSVNYPGGEI